MHEGGDPGHEDARLGPHHQHRLRARPGRAAPQKVAYVAAKHGLLGMTKVAAIELANTGITCNAICPGWVLTPLVQKQLEDSSAKNRQGRRDHQGRVPRRQAADASSPRPSRSARGGLPVLAGRAHHHRHSAVDGWRLGHRDSRPRAWLRGAQGGAPGDGRANRAPASGRRWTSPAPPRPARRGCPATAVAARCRHARSTPPGLMDRAHAPPGRSAAAAVKPCPYRRQGSSSRAPMQQNQRQAGLPWYGR